MNVFPRKKEKEKMFLFLSQLMLLLFVPISRGSSSTSSRWCLNLQEVKAGNAKTTKLVYKVGMIF